MDIKSYSVFDDISEGIAIINSSFQCIYSNKNGQKILSKYLSDVNKIKNLVLDEGMIIKYDNRNYELRISKVNNVIMEGYIISTVDITDFFQMNKEIVELKVIAEKATKAKDDFLANMSHEIRTPMNAIYGMAEILSDMDMSPIEKDYINTIKSASMNLLGIINDILDFSKVESGKIEIIDSDYDIRNVVEEVNNVIAPRAEKAKLNFIVNIDPKIPLKLKGDDKRIKQILINILNNAVKFTQEGTIALKISACIKDDTAKIKFKIKDTGMGIKKEDFHKIFEKFEQVDTKKNRQIEGTGLGLPLSKKLAMLMGGDIEVESEYGKGSTFTVTIEQKIQVYEELFKGIDVSSYNFIICEENEILRKSITDTLESINADYIICPKNNIITKDNAVNFLFYDYKNRNEIDVNNTINIPMINFYDPIDKKENKDIIYIKRPITVFSIYDIIKGGSTKKKAESISFSASNAKIAVVDDNEVNLKVVDGLMKKFAIKPETFTNGHDIIEKLKTGVEYDIIFMDHMMPEMDGIETVQFIRNMNTKYTDEAVIITLTANAIKENVKLFKNAGMNDVLYKPIILEELADILQKYLPKTKIFYEDNNIEEENFLTLPEIKGINIKAALKIISGTFEEYEEILYKFYRTINKKKELIKKYFKEKDIKNYTIEVHGLKSASRFIGAEELSDFAAYLEKCGNDGDIDKIQENTTQLLDMLNEHDYNIGLYFQGKGACEGEEVSKELIEETIEALKESLENFDILNTDKEIKKLKSYKLDERVSKLVDDMEKAMDDVDYEKCLEILDKL